MHVQIRSRAVVPRLALFEMGFRPFFLLAALFAPLSVVVWAGAYVHGWPLPSMTLAGPSWHGHEMLFGYAMAVVAGFLLTAVRNWTGIPTLRGGRLAALCATWLGARLVMGLRPSRLDLAAALDLGFDLGLLVAVAVPIARARQWKQSGIVAKVALLAAANAVFYLGASGIVPSGVRWGLHSGIYLVLSLVFVLARRVLPFFIERGVGHPVELRRRPWVDRASLVLVVLLWLADVFVGERHLIGALALASFVVHSVRLYDWHTPAIWRRPLLWILYVAYGAAVAGFPLQAMAAWGGLAPQLALHAFVVGGIGLMTVGMMARVSLGHTGRNVHAPPRGLSLVFVAMLAAFGARIALPLLAPQHYALAIGMTQFAWAAGFVGFLVLFGPMLVRTRIDGQPG